MDSERERCGWANANELEARYHDEEWGTPCHDDKELFERLMLEGFQAGLSWDTILRKRENFSRAFEGWDPARIAAYTADDHGRLLQDAGIIRNRLKVEGATKNARAFLATQAEFGTFDSYIWSFTGGGVLGKSRPQTMADIPATSPESDAMSKALRKRGFTFVGSTICYAFMQSTGMVDDHVASCWRAR